MGKGTGYLSSVECWALSKGTLWGLNNSMEYVPLIDLLLTGLFYNSEDKEVKL